VCECRRFKLKSPLGQAKDNVFAKRHLHSGRKDGLYQSGTRFLYFPAITNIGIEECQVIFPIEWGDDLSK
jgi:hypothetical protein